MSPRGDNSQYSRCLISGSFEGCSIKGFFTIMLLMLGDPAEAAAAEEGANVVRPAILPREAMPVTHITGFFSPYPKHSRPDFVHLTQCGRRVSQTTRLWRQVQHGRLANSEGACGAATVEAGGCWIICPIAVAVIFGYSMWMMWFGASY